MFKRDTPGMVTLRKRAYPTLVRAHVRGGALPPDVVSAIDAYFASRPGIRAGEAADHGFDPVTDPKRYMAVELTEPAHADLRRVKQLTPADIAEWGRQEDHEWAKSGVTKEQPTAGQVHIDSATRQPARRGKSTPPDELGLTLDSPEEFDDECDLPVKVVKADQEQRIVYGIVLEPDVVDSQGDIVSKEDIELAAHRFLYDQVRIGDQHRKLAPNAVRPVENYIAPCDFQLNGQPVRKGSWVLATHIPDDELWQQVQDGRKGAFSVAGTGRRVPL